MKTIQKEANKGGGQQDKAQRHLSHQECTPQGSALPQRFGTLPRCEPSTLEVK